MRWVQRTNPRNPSTDLTAAPTKVFAGEIPFRNLPRFTATVRVMNGERPNRPADKPLLTCDLWVLMQNCWDQGAHSRPKMSTVLKTLTPILFRTLRESNEPLPEFQAALSQFYESSERNAWINNLSNAELKGFIDFLDDVRQLFNLLASQYRL